MLAENILDKLRGGREFTTDRKTKSSWLFKFLTRRYAFSQNVPVNRKQMLRRDLLLFLVDDFHCVLYVAQVNWQNYFCGKLKWIFPIVLWLFIYHCIFVSEIEKCSLVFAPETLACTYIRINTIPLLYDIVYLLVCAQIGEAASQHFHRFHLGRA